MCFNETIKESNVVEDQLIISNTLFVLKELYAIGEIDRETYVSNLKEAYTVLRGQLKRVLTSYWLGLLVFIQRNKYKEEE